MNTNGILRKHWFHVALHFSADALLFSLSFFLALLLRFGEEAEQAAWMHWPFVALSSVVLAATTYIFGLYSTHSVGKGLFSRALVVAGCVIIAVLVLIGLTYGTLVRPLGRGVTLLGAATAYIAIVIHHIFLLHALRTSRERVAYLVTSPFDEAET